MIHCVLRLCRPRLLSDASSCSHNELVPASTGIGVCKHTHLTVRRELAIAFDLPVATTRGCDGIARRRFARGRRPDPTQLTPDTFGFCRTLVPPSPGHSGRA